jgi:hypothetical protein
MYLSGSLRQSAAPRDKLCKFLFFVTQKSIEESQRDKEGLRPY